MVSQTPETRSTLRLPESRSLPDTLIRQHDGQVQHRADSVPYAVPFTAVTRQLARKSQNLASPANRLRRGVHKNTRKYRSITQRSNMPGEYD
ncbi:hypothetical protein ACTXT7_011699 [Hymenolepis weldensis]